MNSTLVNNIHQTIGIFGGSFNPVHVGHTMLASYIQQFTAIDAVWLTLSPLNPLKSAPSELIPDMQRLEMLQLAKTSCPGVGICDIELSMPRPSYTSDTLDLLAHRFPQKRFKLIIGSDNWQIFEKWRRWEHILENYGVIVYPRPGYPMPEIYIDGVETLPEAPVTDLSSTFIRDAIATGKNMNPFLPPGVYDYIKDHGLYH